MNNTLPDYLKAKLRLVFVGLNPGLISAREGQYFASARNRFWKAANSAGIFEPPLGPATAAAALGQGIGFTDVVKRPTAGASDLRAVDFKKWAPVLKEKLEQYTPSLICFHGSVAYRNYLRYGEGFNDRPSLGLQPRPLGTSAVFLAPNPSAANAAFSLEDLVGWYLQVQALLIKTAPIR